MFMTASVVAAVDELVADGEVASIEARTVGVQRLERRVVVQVQPAVAALVHDPHRQRRPRRRVRHL